MSKKSSIAIDHEIEVLQAQIAILQRREDDFVRILEDMARLRDSVKAEQVALASQIMELESQRHPINWLPSELLIQIFVSVTEDNDSDTSAGLAYNSSPVIITHVCREWRKLAFATSILWSRVSYRSRKWSTSPVCAFINRSGSSLLDLTFSPPPYHVDDNDAAEDERLASEGLLHMLSSHLSRVRSITFECTSSASMRLIVEVLIDNLHELKSLRSLDLSFASLAPCFAGTPLLVLDELDGQSLSDTPSVLTYLRLQQLPPRVISPSLLRSVQTLELSFPQRRSHRAPQYILRMSHVHHFLSFIPELQDLVLTETTPLRDVVLEEHSEGQTADNRFTVVAPLELPKLRSLTWKFAYPRDVYTFMSFFGMPALERWEILIANSPTRRNDVSSLRGNHWDEPDSFIQAEPLGGVLFMTALKELCISCQDGDSLISSLRQFFFPVLEQLEFAYAGKCPPNCDHKHPLPRLDYVFRDPRLPHLTHFTLSHLDVFAGHGKLMLGYMPGLVSLTLISCTGVDGMLEALAEAYGLAMDAERKATRGCGVRVCPKLERITLWGCSDFKFKSLFAAVFARAQPAGNSMLMKAQKDAPSVVSTVLGRKIRPLKKPRVASPRGGPSSPAKPHITQNSHGAPSTLIPIEEALRPVPIACVNVDDCPQISEDEALLLEEFGTVVVYR
ncbi:uncharacterized protein BJ212DRAFT_1300429 [Suillus subaureus]|uniref:F-box domain-containing protein n=1 Tax=Suillus subaureus TaxID=48587 RepID=A0A9P7JCM4_9AGAM|nr:uncharacterized protein BJ212DRAFT_1300429 [Suillus subaureus]KAG1814615.1 hypothetical protein BJ212DRAFT_1300429 [Suillus subaureus]